MALVQRANVILEVKDDRDEIDYYIHKGYNLISDDGNIIESAPPIDIEGYRKIYIEQKEKIAELENTIRSLENEIELLTGQLKAEKKKTVKTKQ